MLKFTVHGHTQISNYLKISSLPTFPTASRNLQAIPLTILFVEKRSKVTKNLQDKIRISTIFQLNSDGVSIRRDLSGRLVLWNLLSTIVNLDLDFGEKCIIFVIRKWGTAKIPAVPFVFPHFIVKIRSDFVKISRRLVKKRLRLF